MFQGITNRSGDTNHQLVLSLVQHPEHLVDGRHLVQVRPEQASRHTVVHMRIHIVVRRRKMVFKHCWQMEGQSDIPSLLVNVDFLMHTKSEVKTRKEVELD